MYEYCGPVDRAEYGLHIREILEVFRRVRAGELENDISLLNYYKGVPINYPAKVLDIDREFVEFETHAYQAVAIRNDRSAFIKSAHLRHDLVAEAFYVKVPTCEVSLKNFLYTRILAENRNYVRVALQAPRLIDIDYAHLQITGRLLDICQKSAAVDLASGFRVRPGTVSRLRMALPMGPGGPDMPIDVLATVSKAIPGPDALRCVFDLQCDVANDGRIARFIGHRQTEIVAEIREAIWAEEAKGKGRGGAGPASP
jgi:hypothetical protein